MRGSAPLQVFAQFVDARSGGGNASAAPPLVFWLRVRFVLRSHVGREPCVELYTKLVSADEPSTLTAASRTPYVAPGSSLSVYAHSC